MNISKLARGFALLVVAALPSLAVTVTTTAGVNSLFSGLTSTITFDCPGTCTTDPAGHATYSGNIGYNLGANPGGGGNFLFIYTSPNITISFDQAINYFGLLWGSPDSYNFVQLFNGATQVGPTFTGNDVNTGVGNYLNLAADPGEQFTSVVIGSTNCCFETDNHSYRLADAPIEGGIPEPAMFFPVALAGAGLFTYRRLRSKF